MNTIKLASGVPMPLIGFGLWKVPNGECADVVYNAIKVGYRLFDGACDYGNEREAGQGVARAIDEGIVKREDLFIVSKLWNTFHSAAHVEEMARKQLRDWNLDYFDLYHIHFPIALRYVAPELRYPPGWFFDGERDVQTSACTIQETWNSMESLVDRGIAKHIGVCNFSAPLIMDLLRYARVRPAVLQIEHHPYLTQTNLVHYAQTEGIAVTGYSSFGAQSYLGLENTKAESVPSLLHHPVILEIADRAGRAPSQVLLRWATQRNVAVIPKSTDAERMLLNAISSEFDLAADEIEKISKLNMGLRFNDPADFLGLFPIYA